MAAQNNCRGTILIIDDEEAVRSSLKDFLEDSGFSVLTAENGREGLEVFSKNPVSLVLVDLRMPESDGLEVIKRIVPESPDVPVIVVSGTGVISDAVEALRCGAWDYILKPVKDFSVLMHVIVNALEKAGLKADNARYQQKLELMVRKRTQELEEEIRLRKNAEAEILRALSDKELLLQEVHHRVKNNMAIISAFIGFKEESLADDEVRGVFQDIQQRIKAMALVHEKLYRSDNFMEVSVRDYLRELMDELFSNYVAEKPVELIDDMIEDLLFPVDLLIPVGLITNEIVLNSFKHAFAETENPKITVELIVQNDSSVLLRIADNGCGFSRGGGRSEPGGIGLEIIKALADQLKGRIETETTAGTEYRIYFPVRLD